MDIHHIGYAVRNIEKARDTFKSLGFIEDGTVVFDEDRNVNILFLKNQSYRIELIAPADMKKVSPVNCYIKSGGGGQPYHVCYETYDLNKKIEQLKKDKFVLAEDAKKAPAIGNRRVAFLYKRAVGLIELVEMQGIG